MEAHSKLATGRKSVRLFVEMSLMENVNRKRCYIALDHDTQLTSAAVADEEKTYELPDGNIITVGAKRFRCAEVLF